MKTFKQIVREKEGFFIDKHGHAVPEQPIHFKHLGKKPKKHKKKKLKEEAPAAGVKAPRTKYPGLHELPGQHYVPPNPRWVGNSTPEKQAVFDAASKKAEAAHDKTSEELHSHQRKITEDEHSYVSDYTDGDEGGTHSHEIAMHLIKNHKEGKPPTHNMDDYHKDMHHTISNLANQKLGKEVHLYSGVGFNPRAAANRSKDKVIHLPAHISASHDVDIAHSFASINVGNNVTSAQHIIHIHAKATDKGYHVGEHSLAPEEHETIIPAGTKLKYSHTTVHKDDNGMKVHVHHFTIHSQE